MSFGISPFGRKVDNVEEFIDSMSQAMRKRKDRRPIGYLISSNPILEEKPYVVKGILQGSDFYHEVESKSVPWVKKEYLDRIIPVSDREIKRDDVDQESFEYLNFIQSLYQTRDPVKINTILRSFADGEVCQNLVIDSLFVESKGIPVGLFYEKQEKLIPQDRVTKLMKGYIKELKEEGNTLRDALPFSEETLRV